MEPRIVWHSHRLVLHTTPHPLSCPHAEEPRLEPHSRALGALLRMRRLNACRVRGSSLNRWRIPISRCQTARLNAAPRVGVSSFRVGVERSGEPRRRWSDPCIFLFFLQIRNLPSPVSRSQAHTYLLVPAARFVRPGGLHLLLRSPESRGGRSADPPPVPPHVASGCLRLL